MEYRILGRTGLRVSAVALGCEGFIHKTPEEVCADFDFAIGHGVNFIDIYSPNPELRTNIGAALEGRRGDFIIQGHLCTTWENGQYLRTRDPEKTLASFDLQLQQLRTDCLDIGMIHYVDAEADFHRVFGGEIIRIAQRLREEGRIRHIGISSHNPAVARMAVETGLVDVLMFSVNPCYDLQPAGDDVEALWAEESYAGALRNIDPDRERLYELCERTGVGIDAMKVYGGGDLLNAENSPFGKAMTPVQCIEYALTRPGVASVMVGCRTQDEIRAALDWCGASPAERDYASAMAGMERFTWEGHCMYCGHCAPCSAGIDIATVHKFHNLAVAQGEIPETVREHYAALTHHASECIGCGAITFEQRVELREGLESVLLFERHHDVAQLMLQIAPKVIDPVQFFRFCLHAAVFGHMQAVLVFQRPANRHGAPQFVVVVDLPALLVHPHRDDVHVSPCDVFVQKDDIGLAAISHAFHELGGKLRKLRFRKPVFGRGVEREMHDRFSDTGIERRVVPEGFRTLLDTEPAVAAFGYSLHV